VGGSFQWSLKASADPSAQTPPPKLSPHLLSHLSLFNSISSQSISSRIYLFATSSHFPSLLNQIASHCLLAWIVFRQRRLLWGDSDPPGPSEYPPGSGRGGLSIHISFYIFSLQPPSFQSSSDENPVVCFGIHLYSTLAVRTSLPFLSSPALRIFLCRLETSGRVAVGSSAVSHLGGKVERHLALFNLGTRSLLWIEWSLGAQSHYHPCCFADLRVSPFSHGTVTVKQAF
jgi:hypothetical protein